MENDCEQPGLTILVIDDDAAVRNSLAFSLRTEGFAVRTYARAEELLDAPDLPAHGCLVIDYRLTDMTGLELLTELRRRQVLLPAVLITTHPSPIVRERAANAGILVIEKPLLGDALLQGIREVLADDAR